jgi:CubicO group peptidase (beta-lactamase class C family)
VGAPEDFTAFMKQEVFDKLGMTTSSYSPSSGIGTGWTGGLNDMAKLGTMLLHDGWYNDEQLLSPIWVYRLSHPAFESSNTAYGHLSWVNHRGGSVAPGGATTAGDECSPASFWRKYPHYQSEATDCAALSGSCEQKYDVGVFSARGLGGQEITMHPGLDLVIVARNYSGGVEGMWNAVRPGLVAMDDTYKGDETAFCKDYGAGNYAPDLLAAREDGL